MNKTFAPNPKEVEKKWHFIDAENKVLGRVAAEVVVLLMGKNKAEFSPNEVVGDKVVITNAKNIAVTGNKLKDKLYQHHTGFPGGLRTETLGKLMARKPNEALKRAIYGMLPKNKLRDRRMTNLYIYEGAEHPHTAQETHAKK